MQLHWYLPPNSQQTTKENKTNLTTNMPHRNQGSHYILVLKFKDFQGPWSCIFKDQFSTEVYSMDSITAILMSVSVITGQF